MKLFARRSFPCGITIMFLDKRRDIAKCIVFHRGVQIFRTAIEQDVLVHFVISRENVAIGFNLFVSAKPMPE
jgi:hypothetical protein